MNELLLVITQHPFLFGNKLLLVIRREHLRIVRVSSETSFTIVKLIISLSGLWNIHLCHGDVDPVLGEPGPDRQVPSSVHRQHELGGRLEKEEEEVEEGVEFE